MDFILTPTPENTKQSKHKKMKTKKIIGKMWFVMSDLTVEKFNIDDEGFATSTSGLEEYIIYTKGNRYCTKREALEASKAIKKLFKTL